VPSNCRLAFRGLALLSAFGTAAPALAQDGEGAPRLSLDATSRVRFEAIDGQFRPNTAADDMFVSFRTTAAARLDIGAFTLGGEIVDARGYAQDARSSVRTNEVNALEPVQAYAAAKAGLAGGTATLTGGRFSMDIGSSRLVGRTDFPNTVQSYLGAMAEWKSKGKDRVIAFWTRPFQPLPDGIDDIRDNKVELDRAGGNVTFFGASALAAKAWGATSLEAYGYRLAEDDRAGRPTRDRHLVTAGARLRRAPAKARFDYEAEGAYQWGSARSTSAATDLRDLDVRASFAHAEAGWTFAKGWTPRVSAMFDYASGDGNDASTYGRFDTLYGAARADFGPRSLFAPVGRANLVSPGMRIEAKPSKRLDLMAAGRGLWLAQATDSFASTGVRDRSGASGRYAGIQAEARVRRSLVPERLRVEVGAAYLAKGGFLKRAPNAPATGDTRYGFVDLVASF
jgi:hypothetical protein